MADDNPSNEATSAVPAVGDVSRFAGVLVLLALLLVGLASTALGQATITGTVMDSVSNTRVAAAQVVLFQVGSSQTAITDSTGRFRFEIEPGMATIRITALGYGELSSGVLVVEKHERLSILAFVSTAPLEVLPLYVVAKSRRPPTALEGFHQRKKRGGFGYFLDEKAIARISAFEVSDYLRRIPGVRRGRDNVQLRPYCSDANYLVDGLPVLGMQGMSATELVNSMVSTADVAAIEVYKSDIAVPAELMIASSGMSAGSCGIVAIWTKR